MQNILVLLRQRQVFKVATIYVLSAWTLIQLADLAVPVLGLPESIMALLLKIFLVGFPISLIFAWLINFTNSGLVLASSESETIKTRNINLRATIAVAGSLALALLVTFTGQHFFGTPISSVKKISDNTQLLPRSTLLSNPVDNKKSIAVLPFVVFSSDPEDEFFVDGMIEELLNVLAQIPDLQVAARTSSFSYRGITDKTISVIGNELGVGTILEGSFRKNDVSNEIRVTAQLIDVSSGEHIWSETYKKDYADIFQIQDEIAHAVAIKMKISLLEETNEQYFSAGTESVDAMVEYGKGQSELSHRTVPSMQKALQHFKNALIHDNGYARAYVGIADANILLALYGTLPTKEANSDAKKALDAALVLNPQLAAAHASTGLLLSQTDRIQAEISLKRAIELNPNYAMAYMWYGSLMKTRGDIVKANQLFGKAFMLDPKSPTAAYNVAWGHYSAGDEDLAMQLFSQIIANDPYYPGAYNLVGDILSDRGQLDEAISLFERALLIDKRNKNAIIGLLTSNMDMLDTSGTERWFSYLNDNPNIITTNELLYLNARFAASRGEIRKTLKLLEKVESDHTDMKFGFLVRSEIAIYEGDYIAIIEILEKLKQNDKDNRGVFFSMANGRAAQHLAHAYQKLSRQEEAERLLSEYELFLQSSISKKAKNSNYYYSMAVINALRGRQNDALSYLQAAIDAGWVQVWQADINPIFLEITQQLRYKQMIGGVNARLANMRTKLQNKRDLLAGEENFI